jgi:hypothetical protein
MKKVLLCTLVLCTLTSYAFAQMRQTMIGRTVTGEIVSTDQTTREITIKYPGEKGPEMFTGFLVEGYKKKLKDGSQREIMMSDLPAGMRVMMLYKDAEQKVGGKKQKIYRITSVLSLGKDDFARFRSQLNIDPDTPVEKAEDAPLPQSPLKLYVSTSYPGVLDSVAEWLNKWNQKYAEKYGEVQFVSELDRADVYVVAAKGADSMIASIQADVYHEGNKVDGNWTFGTGYLAVKTPDGLKVLRMARLIVLSTKDGDAVSANGFTSELERRLKARGKK